ncbi:MAG: hypothetical protein OER98_15980 [Gammaproteobacteria bacterium]|nr:hypothetical protein [Gammaproteobacteria bacterium]
MNNYEDWAILIAKKLKGEADLIAAIEKDELEDSAAKDAFVRIVLEPFLPENYGIGSGRIVDAFGNYSDHLEVIVYNRDFPRIGMPGIQDAYLYESVLATFSVRAKFIRKTFFASLDACASLAQLETNMDKTVLIRLAKKNGLKPGPNKRFIHEDPLRTARFDLIGRPPGFVYGFSGIKNSYRQLQENIDLWIDHRQKDGISTPMKALPAVIATQGCFAWRNAAPLALSNREMLGIGNDEAPIRLIVLQMLYLLNRRLHITADGYGLKPNLSKYLSQFSGPKFEIGVGNVYEMENMKSARDTMRFEPARDHTPIAAALSKKAPKSAKPKLPKVLKETAPVNATPEPKPAPKETAPVDVAPEPKPAPKEAAPVSAPPEPKPAAKETAPVNAAPEPKPVPKETAPASPAPEPKPTPKEAAPAAASGVFDKPSPFASVPTPSAAQESTPDSAPAASSGVFDKPSPFASAPPPSAAQESTPDSAPAASSGVFDKPSPFASAPAPQAQEAEAEPPRPAARVSSLGSAPIPQMSGSETAAESKPAPMPTTPLGSAPIPPMSAPEPAQPPAAPLGSAPIPPSEPGVSKVIPPKPPVDFDLGSEVEELEDKVQPEEDDFESTVIIPPNAGASSNEAAKDSTNAFIARVKEQLSSEPEIDKEQKPFSSTIPQ